MAKHRIHSQSSINTFLTCPYLYKLKYIDGVFFSETSEFMEFGKQLHKILERYFNNISDYNFGVDEEIKILAEKIIKEFIYESSNLFSEKDIFIKIKNDLFMVKCDLIEVKNNQIIVHDWKSSKKIKDENDYLESLQTKLYLYAIYKYSNQVNFEDISIKYWFPRIDNMILEKKYDENDYISFEKEIYGIIEKINSTDFENLKNECRECNVSTKKCFVKKESLI